MLWVGVWYVQFSSIILKLHWISPKKLLIMVITANSWRYETSTIHLIDETFCKKKICFSMNVTGLYSFGFSFQYHHLFMSCGERYLPNRSPTCWGPFPYLRSIAWNEFQFGKPRDEVKNSTPPWPGASCSLSKVVDEENRFFLRKESAFFCLRQTHTRRFKA